jgi:flavin reductase (DIM6/NTAB) family NADH-FMN oxidoreductase RutF
MKIRGNDFRDALRHFPAGVTLVTVRSGERIHGLTVSAFCSVSPEPPLVAVVIDQKHNAFDLLQAEGAVFAVNILGEEQAELSDRFAWKPEKERFEAGDWSVATTGAPVLDNALAWLDCRIVDRYPAGTHTIYVGEVQESSVPRSDEKPLIYWNRDYRKLD